VGADDNGGKLPVRPLHKAICNARDLDRRAHQRAAVPPPGLAASVPIVIGLGAGASLAIFRAVPTDILHLDCASCRHADGRPRIAPEEWSGASNRPRIIRMTTTSRPQHRYDHRPRDLVQRPGDLTIATDLGVPRSTARGWLGAAPTVVVGLDSRTP
jgi:hypothetical protein